MYNRIADETSDGVHFVSRTAFLKFMMNQYDEKVEPIRYTVNGANKVLDDTDMIDSKKVSLLSVRKQVQTRYGMLYNDYVTKAFLWEVWEMLRKLILSSGLIFISRGSPIQITIALIISAISLTGKSFQ